MFCVIYWKVKNKVKITYQEAMARDAILFDLARYDAMGGQIPFSENEEDFLKIQLDIHKNSALLFNRYKKLIRIGEFTFEEMVDDILARNAAFEQPKKTFNKKTFNINCDKELNDMFNSFEKKLTIKENENIISDLTDKLNKVLLGYQKNYNKDFKIEERELESEIGSEVDLKVSPEVNGNNAYKRKHNRKTKGKTNEKEEKSDTN